MNIAAEENGVSYNELVAEASNQICLAESPNMVMVGKVLP